MASCRSVNGNVNFTTAVYACRQKKGREKKYRYGTVLRIKRGVTTFVSVSGFSFAAFGCTAGEFLAQPATRADRTEVTGNHCR
jgi:hypothetical protein